MMIYVGIDISILNHFASAISSDGEILIEPFQFTNNGDGFQLLISKPDSFDKNSLIIGLESTGTTATTLSDILLLRSTKCVCSTLSRLPLCEKITFARPRPIKSTLTSFAKHL